jgi:hypothetical protein
MIIDLEPSQVMPFERNPRFTIHESELERLEKLLSQSSQTTNVAIKGQSSLSCIMENVENLCNCRQVIVQRASRIIFTGLKFFSQTALLHRQDCLYFRNQKVTKKMGLRIIQPNKLVGAVIEVSCTLQSGAGDLSISPYLALRGFSRKNSPAFALFEEFGWGKVVTLPQQLSSMRQIPTRLNLLFSTGEASPNETNEFGETLLHVSLTHRRYSETY